MNKCPCGSLLRTRAKMETGVKISEHLQRAAEGRKRKEEAGRQCLLFIGNN